MASTLDALGAGEFKGFESADFEAFAQKKWGSNVYTLERRAVKQKLASLARILSDEMEELTEFDVGASDEAPSMSNGRKVKSQWVYFTRPERMRNALRDQLSGTDLASASSLFDIAVEHEHTSLLMRLDDSCFTLEILVAGKAKVDRANLKEKLQKADFAEELVSLCQELPGGIEIGFEGQLVDALTISAETISGWSESFDGSENFLVRLQLGAQEELLMSEGLIGTLEEYFNGLIPLFRYFSWSRDNSHVTFHLNLEKEMRAQKSKKKGKSSSLAAGTRVTILSGMFAGRAGYVSEIDKGKVKVMVGPVSVSVDAKDLKVNS